MAGIEIHVDLSGLDPAIAALNKMGETGRERVLPAVAALVESQTRRRIADDKTSPGGEPWVAWSADYAASRKPGQSMLIASGGLLDSIAWQMDGDEAAVGSDLVYAAAHQFGPRDGETGPPQREWLGLSAEDEAEIEALMHDLFGGAQP